MNKSLRLSEKWFRFGLWLVAFAFASFLIGLGDTIVANLPKMEHRYSLEDFIEQPAAENLRAELKAMQTQRLAAQNAHDQAQLKLNSARANSLAAHETFNNWLATRHATKRPDQDSELIERTQALDELKILERKALADVERQQQNLLDARQTETRAQGQLRQLEKSASALLNVEMRQQELRIFAYRLALTLPLLIVAGWLFAKKRQGTWWPFVWGFIYFALFAFFVELVPYLPSYGGYVRYVVGIIITVLIGRYAIMALNRYLEKQKQAEAMPDIERRKELSYDTALARLAKKVCPGCERQVDLGNTAIDFCPHCGICLYDHCANCKARKSAFSRFCHACGTLAGKGAA